jgi:hypothetical protein
MPSIKKRLEKLEDTLPSQSEDRIVMVERVIIGRFNPDGTPVTVIRPGKPPLNSMSWC